MLVVSSSDKAIALDSGGVADDSGCGGMIVVLPAGSLLYWEFGC